MADQYSQLRALPLTQVLTALGVEATSFKSRKGGAEQYGPCPVCEPRRNRGNFSYHQDGKFRCFSCSAKGRGAIDLYMAVAGCGFQDAVSALGPINVPQASVIVPKTTMTEPTVTENAPFKATYEKFFRPHEWLDARGLKPETLACYEVGFYENPARRSAYNGSVMLKIRRYSDGECVGYISRNIGEITPEKPKYVLPKGLQKSLELWGARRLKDVKPIRVLYVVESPFSVMHFHQLGFPAVSPLGWCLSPQQVEILADLAKGVVFLPDADKRKEAQAYAGPLATRLWVKMPEMPASDPEQLTREQILAL